jgi:hypothetical protein
MLKRTLAAILFILFVGIPGFVLVEGFSSSFQSCINQQTGRDSIAVIISYSRCTARFVNDHNGALSALATLVVAAFTFTLWLIASSQLRHAREVDRAYVSGGGPGNPPDGPFYLTINNYGGTPATLIEYAVEFCELGAIPSSPKYLDGGYKRTRGGGIYPPGAHGWLVAEIPYAEKQLREPVVYGRFWYEDVWKKQHYHSFILTLAPRSLPTNISPAYTEWT